MEQRETLTVLVDVLVDDIIPPMPPPEDEDDDIIIDMPPGPLMKPPMKLGPRKLGQRNMQPGKNTGRPGPHPKDGTTAT